MNPDIPAAIKVNIWLFEWACHFVDCGANNLNLFLLDGAQSLHVCKKNGWRGCGVKTHDLHGDSICRNGVCASNQNIHPFGGSGNRTEILLTCKSIDNDKLWLYEVMDVDEILPKPKKVCHIFFKRGYSPLKMFDTKRCHCGKMDFKHRNAYDNISLFYG